MIDSASNAVCALSDALHARVRRFILSSMRGRSSETFDALACDIARFQQQHVEPVARLMNARAVDATALASAAEIVALPCDVFRLRRVAAHRDADDGRCFVTSGTTAAERGRHPMRTTTTYALAALRWGRAMLWPDRKRLDFLGLVADESTAADSSLTFMLARFAEALGGEASWHYRAATLDVEGIARRIRLARRPLLVAGTSFTFVHLLDALDGRCLALPAGSRVMQTGGFKGRSREVDAASLQRAIASCFAIDETYVIAEYGMTELSSQLYQGALRAALGLAACSADRRYHAPPWVRVGSVDPQTLQPTGGVGLCRIVDLANVDSAVAIQTSDLVRTAADGSIELLGRAPGTTPRGCSLLHEHLSEHRSDERP